MKVKHWAGYGTLNAKALRKGPDYKTIELSGNHEQGLIPRYWNIDDWVRWLGKRFGIAKADYVFHMEDWSERRREDVAVIHFSGVTWR